MDHSVRQHHDPTAGPPDPSGRVSQSEYRNLGPAIESHSEQVTQAAADEQPAAVVEIEFSGSVTPVGDREHRGRQERGLALAAVRVACKDPPLKPRPVVAVGRIATGDG